MNGGDNNLSDLLLTLARDLKLLDRNDTFESLLQKPGLLKPKEGKRRIKVETKFKKQGEKIKEFRSN